MAQGFKNTHGVQRMYVAYSTCHLRSVIQKDGLNFVHLYFLNYT